MCIALCCWFTGAVLFSNLMTRLYKSDILFIDFYQTWSIFPFVCELKEYLIPEYIPPYFDFQSKIANQKDMPLPKAHNPLSTIKNILTKQYKVSQLPSSRYVNSLDRGSGDP